MYVCKFIDFDNDNSLEILRITMTVYGNFNFSSSFRYNFSPRLTFSFFVKLLSYTCVSFLLMYISFTYVKNVLSSSMRDNVMWWVT